MTPDLIAFLKREEGLRLDPYLDVAGYPTIGYGHRIPSMDYPCITETEADRLLIEDIQKHEADALRLSPGLAHEPAPRLDAITDFCFNLGAGRYGASVLRLRVNERRWHEAAVQMRRWVHAKNRKTGRKEPMPGLVRRRAVTARWLEFPTDDRTAA